ncbi:MAG TPA: glycerophosphodiester phosphodiesterase [Gemmatimonadales bacterium]|nr:glycerophosphodiester phosphodiesterase [Gemmatimonadales bacterium]
MPITDAGHRPASPRILGHRGASGHATENSLEAFRLAAALGADGVELDVHATRDGAILVHHDPDLPGLGAIRRLSAADARRHRLPNGEPVPSLEQALDVLRGLEVWVEVKGLAPEHDRRLLDTLDAGPEPARYRVHSFDHRIVARLSRTRPGLRGGALLSSYLVDFVEAVKRARAVALWQEWHLIDDDLVAAAHEAGLEVIAWTVDDPAACRQLAAAGVDALCGNWPDRIRAALERGAEAQ